MTRKNSNNYIRSKAFLYRPDGDSVAAKCGKYFTLERIKKISTGDRCDILCSDGLNYIVEVKSFDKNKLDGHLHFPSWSSHHDYRGSFKHLYLVDEGTYSTKAGINLRLNKYGSPKVKPNKGQKDQNKARVISAPKRYPDNFFQKPRMYGNQPVQPRIRTQSRYLLKRNDNNESSCESDSVSFETVDDEYFCMDVVTESATVEASSTSPSSSYPSSSSRPSSSSSYPSSSTPSFPSSKKIQSLPIAVTPEEQEESLTTTVAVTASQLLLYGQPWTEHAWHYLHNPIKQEDSIGLQKYMSGLGITEPSELAYCTAEHWSTMAGFLKNIPQLALLDLVAEGQSSVDCNACYKR